MTAGAPFHIRGATARDADALSALEAACFGAAAWGDGQIAEAVSMDGVSVLVAERASGDALVGFALWRSVADEAEILTVGVKPSARRAGLGAQLLAEMLMASRAAGAKALFLEVAETNAAARALYARAGFAAISERPRYYRNGDTAIVMRRDLVAPPS